MGYVSNAHVNPPINFAVYQAVGANAAKQAYSLDTSITDYMKRSHLMVKKPSFTQFDQVRDYMNKDHLPTARDNQGENKDILRLPERDLADLVGDTYRKTA